MSTPSPVAVPIEDFLRRFLPIVQAVGTVAERFPIPPTLALAVEAAVDGSMLGEALLAQNGTITPDQWAKVFSDFDDAELKAQAAIEQAPTPDP